MLPADKFLLQQASFFRVPCCAAQTCAISSAMRRQCHRHCRNIIVNIFVLITGGAGHSFRGVCLLEACCIHCSVRGRRKANNSQSFYFRKLAAAAPADTRLIAATSTVMPIITSHYRCHGHRQQHHYDTLAKVAAIMMMMMMMMMMTMTAMAVSLLL